MNITSLSATQSTDNRRVGDHHASLFAVIRDQLRDRILSGEFHPGDRLVEGKLATEMGVSRIPVREALRELASEGLVTIEPRRGASVSVLSPDIAYNMAEVRAALEGLNAKLAAQRRNQNGIEQLQQILDQGKAAVEREDLDLLQSLNREFHETLAGLSGNIVLTELMRSLRDRTALLFAPSNLQRVRQNWEDHAQILNAVINGNSDLANLLASQHVHNAAQAYQDMQASEATSQA
ncbi:GntR family transcriptional regulator [Paenalcaligenes suwonensis]|uniref:GntR family transcriptional regulator n=1 Tax=Paenalcaligenes suwonensis TaxID=1202713 RepID=UPI00140CC5D1|nr:GntR family transcriptional regulator [Paenalcaligenes suwonensis]NHC60179.1 GntR family transcriptional regulator [Paenalcaligenes suwonensis]